MNSCTQIIPKPMHIHLLQIDQGTREVFFIKKSYKEVHSNCKD